VGVKVKVHYHAFLKCGCGVGFDVEGGLPKEGEDVQVEMPCQVHRGTFVSQAVERVEGCTTCKA
jgi:hypothetical protein